MLVFHVHVDLLFHSVFDQFCVVRTFFRFSFIYSNLYWNMSAKPSRTLWKSKGMSRINLSESMA